MRRTRKGSDAVEGIWNRMTFASRRVVTLGVALVLVTAAWASPARAVESKDVNVVNTPTVMAQQSGTWDVGIDRVRIPFQHSLHFLTPELEVGAFEEFVVPAGHRLVIEQVTAISSLPPDQVAYAFYVATTVGGVLAQHVIPPTSPLPGVFVGCQQVRLYAEPGTAVRFTAFRNKSSGIALTEGSISGYLVPVP